MNDFIPDMGDEVKWQDHPERKKLESEVKTKVNEMTLSPLNRQAVDYIDALKFLKKFFGVTLTALMCSVNEKDVSLVLRKKNPKKLSAIQARNVGAAYLIAEIMLAHFSVDLVKEWLIAFHEELLYGIPAVEMSKRPEDVRLAALYDISHGLTLE